MLTPKWEELAGKLRNTVKVAYVDTEAGPTPRQVGQVQGTPTIKAFVPKRSSAKNEKTIVDYDQAREVKDLLRFATGRMPNYVESVEGATTLQGFNTKAQKWGLPRVLVFTDKAGQTASTLKALSAEYRRRVLIGELKARKHAAAAAAFRVTSFPTLLCLSPETAAGSGEGAEHALHRFERKEATYHRLNSFVGKCALRKPVLRQPVAARAAEGKEEL